MKKGFHQNAAYETFKPKLKKPDKPIIFLTRKEQEQLRDYQIPDSKQYLERVRDVFAFYCFTGLRYSDVYNLRRSDIKDDHIEITTIKTTDHLKIELNKHSRSILEKYKDIPFKNDKALPVISNQKMNDYLNCAFLFTGIQKKCYLFGYLNIHNITFAGVDEFLYIHFQTFCYLKQGFKSRLGRVCAPLRNSGGIFT